MPPPHESEQGVQFLKFSKRQSSGHWSFLHALVSLSDGQWRPPCVGLRATTRARVWVPFPQLFEQCVQMLNSRYEQSTGQVWLAHVRFSDKNGQIEPFTFSCFTTVLDRTCSPPQHEWEHGVQLPNLDTSQCSGHGPLLQDTMRVVSGQVRPPAAASLINTRDFCCEPMPQVTEQDEEVFQSDTIQS